MSFFVSVMNGKREKYISFGSEEATGIVEKEIAFQPIQLWIQTAKCSYNGRPRRNMDGVFMHCFVYIIAVVW